MDEADLTALKGKDLVAALDFRKLPKVLLHEHLDGGLRPATVIELARENGYKGLPTEDAGELAAWFHRGAQRGNLPEYLEGFAHTCGVMQSKSALEMCLYSNLHTGACHDLTQHPFGLFFRNGFRVCLNTDDRLMSDTSMTKETILATELFDLSLADLEKLNINAMKSAFAPYGKRLQVIFDTLKPGYAVLRGEIPILPALAKGSSFSSKKLEQSGFAR